MICPIKNLGHLINPKANQIYSTECTKDCAWWNPKANFNIDTKQVKGECCILTLSNLRISGLINTHPA